MIVGEKNNEVHLLLKIANDLNISESYLQ